SARDDPDDQRLGHRGDDQAFLHGAAREHLRQDIAPWPSLAGCDQVPGDAFVQCFCGTEVGGHRLARKGCPRAILMIRVSTGDRRPSTVERCEPSGRLCKTSAGSGTAKERRTTTISPCSTGVRSTRK